MCGCGVVVVVVVFLVSLIIIMWFIDNRIFINLCLCYVMCVCVDQKLKKNGKFLLCFWMFSIFFFLFLYLSVFFLICLFFLMTQISYHFFCGSELWLWWLITNSIRQMLSLMMVMTNRTFYIWWSTKHTQKKLNAFSHIHLTNDIERNSMNLNFFSFPIYYLCSSFVCLFCCCFFIVIITGIIIIIIIVRFLFVWPILLTHTHRNDEMRKKKKYEKNNIRLLSTFFCILFSSPFSIIIFRWIQYIFV